MEYIKDRVNLITPTGENNPKLFTELYPEHSLTWNDFEGKPDLSSPWVAYTYWRIGYKHRANFTKDRVNLELKVSIKLEDKSWTKQKEDNCLLKHEQGHFNIGLLCALEFKKRAREYKFTRDYNVELKKLFKETLEEFLKLEKLYDDETCHYKNKEKQREWENKIERALGEYRRINRKLFY